MIRAYAQPATLLARLGGPVSWRLQKVAALGYLRALHRAADGRMAL